MKKKLATILLVAVLIMAVFCGCNNSTTQTESEEEAPVAQEEEKAVEEEAEEEKAVCAIRVMSYNMRCYNATTTNFQDKWLNRRSTIITRIKNNDPDLIGTQELTMVQKAWVVEQLGSTYACVGIPRDTVDGVESGEGAYIFYKTSVFELLDSGTEWLSETPDVCSKGWDGACRRVVTFVRLKHKASGQVIAYYNTHLDHKGKEAIKNGNNQILAHIQAETVPCIYTGDFNFTEDNANYPIITAVMNDSKYIATESDGYCTYNAYNTERLENESYKPIDHCFVSKDVVTVQSYKVDDELINGMFGSDHFPIVVDMTIGNQN